MRTFLFACVVGMALAASGEAVSAPAPTAATVSVPIGAVVPFFGSKAELAALGPAWLPADGRLVADSHSPLNGRNLPNLIDRFPMGVNPAENIPAGDAARGGSAETSQEKMCCFSGQHGTNQDANGFVIDTAVDEIRSGRHTHDLIPKYQKLYFIVRVR